MIHDLFIQVLLFRDERDWSRGGPALWAALKEVSTLYNLDQKRANFRRCFLSEWIPAEIDQEVEIDQKKVKETLSSRDWWDTIRTSSPESPKLFSDEEQYGIQETLDQADPAENVLYDLVTDESDDTVDKTILIKEVRKLIGNVPTSVPLLVVTDQELTPPPSWNYIIWDGLDEELSFVVSTKPIHPRYWGMRSTRVNAIIKQRVRAACCSAVGQMLGLRRCSNLRCFLYTPVESVSDLDEMSHLGREHEIPELSGMGYQVEQDEPTAFTVAPLVRFEPD